MRAHGQRADGVLGCSFCGIGFPIPTNSSSLPPRVPNKSAVSRGVGVSVHYGVTAGRCGLWGWGAGRKRCFERTMRSAVSRSHAGGGSSKDEISGWRALEVSTTATPVRTYRTLHYLRDVVYQQFAVIMVGHDETIVAIWRVRNAYPDQPTRFRGDAVPAQGVCNSTVDDSRGSTTTWDSRVGQCSETLHHALAVYTDCDVKIGRFCHRIVDVSLPSKCRISAITWNTSTPSCAEHTASFATPKKESH